MQHDKYLFIRILEACNADCFMCGYAKSKDRYRFDIEDLMGILPRVYQEGVRYIRFTGGEPFMHKQILDFVKMTTKQGIKSSIITNGYSLSKKAEIFKNAGLDHLVVSIDGIEETHDNLRGTPKLFSKCISGIKAAVDSGIKVRVNTVVGPDNFKEMPILQDLFTDLGVYQWEMSSLKLGGPLNYKEGDREIINKDIIPKIFEEGNKSGKLIPFGKYWCGNTKEEQDLYFSEGSTPSVDNICYVVDHVRYFDARNGKLYACSLIPHREESEKHYPAVVKDTKELSMEAEDIIRQAEFFKKSGAKICTGCSTTATSYNDTMAKGLIPDDWAY